MSDVHDRSLADDQELAAGLAAVDALVKLRHDELASSGPLSTRGEEAVVARKHWLADGCFAELCEVVPLDDLELTLLLAVLAPHVDDRYSQKFATLVAAPAGHASPHSLAPTIEMLRNLVGRTISGRRAAVAALDPRSLLHGSRLVRTEPSPMGQLAATVLPSDATLELLLGIASEVPELRPDFPATPLRTVHGLDDLVVAPSVRRQLDHVLARVRNAQLVLDTWGVGRHHDNVHGLTLLLHGPPGTGKTMTAAVLASELGLPALRVDLSSLVSKYIGETAKNLERVFQHAEQRQCLLFFDEADSVFGRRGEVNDARDRYANQEVSYLLQRIEAFPGIVVLATNLLVNIDQAFVRRMDVMLELAAPDTNQRIALWERAYPADVPQDNLVCSELAERYPLTGAQIKAAAIDAAYRAASNGGVVTQDHVVKAAKAQFTKSGLMAPS